MCCLKPYDEMSLRLGFMRSRLWTEGRSFRFCAHNVIFHNEAVSDVGVESAFVHEAVGKICGYRALIVFVYVQIYRRVAKHFCSVFYKSQREGAVALAAYRRQYIEFGQKESVGFFFEYDIAADFAVVLERVKLCAVVEKREHRVLALKVFDHIFDLRVGYYPFVTFVPYLVCEARYFRDTRGICDFLYFSHIYIIICAPARVKRGCKTEIK